MRRDERRIRRGVVGLAALCAALIGLSVCSSFALAAREYEGSFTGFEKPFAVSVDPFDRIWVSDHSAARITAHDSLGAIVAEQDGKGQWFSFTSEEGGLRSAAINSANESLYVTDSSGGSASIHVFDAEGQFVENWEGFPFGNLYLAIDNSGGPSNGRVYVGLNAGGSVRAFSPSGDPVSFSASGSYIDGGKLTGTPKEGSAGVEGFLEVRNVTVDHKGNIYVVDEGRHQVDMFASTGAFVRIFKVPDVAVFKGAAVDPLTDHLYVADWYTPAIIEFDATGSKVGEIKGTAPGSPFGSLQGGIAFNSGGELFVADTLKHTVEHFGPAFVLPKITYPPVTEETPTSGTLHASINLNGGAEVTECHFEYGQTFAYGNSVSCSPSIPPTYSTSPTSVSAPISGLTNDVTNHYRLVVTTATGTRKGSDRRFTPHAVAGVSTGPATDVGPGQATLTGSFQGDGKNTHYYFQWGPTSAYGNTAPSPPGSDAGSPTDLTPVSTMIDGLTSLNEYHYRLVASNNAGTTYGADQSFISGVPDMPVVSGGTVTALMPNSAVVQAKVDPGFGATIYRIEYGIERSFRSRTLPSDSIGNDGVDHVVGKTLTDLTPGTTYNFRVAATNFSGTSRGAEGSFTTPDAPAIDSAIATGLTPSSATLIAGVTPRGSPTTVHFEYGTGFSYGTRTPESPPLGSDHTSHATTDLVTGLAPNTTYHFRVVAANEFGTAAGPDQTFVTSSAPTSSQTPVKCRKGFVKKKGDRCVKRKQRHKGGRKRND